MMFGMALPQSSLRMLGKGGTLNGRDKLKSHPAILLLRSIDAIKQENGAWRPLHDYLADFM